MFLNFPLILYLIEYFLFNKALNCIWHINHFRCFQCNADLGGSYVDVDGSPFCKQCYLLKNAPKCKGCTNPITGAYINAIGAYWHADCFACRVSLVFLFVIFSSEYSIRMVFSFLLHCFPVLLVKLLQA